MRLIIGLFKINTQATQNISVANRVENVKAAVEELKRYTESVLKRFTTPDEVEMRAVFLAPEYAFARSVNQGDHSFGQKRQIEEDYVKNSLRPVFEDVSKGFRNALIVPGTVAWRKSMIPALPGKHGSVEAGEAYRRDKYQKRIQSTVDVN